jgi:AGZA family xanthine/uracil permease-like MFS transporter
MMMAVRQIDWTDYTIAIPGFLAITLMPFTYSISNGIGAGIISFVVLKLAVGKAREIHPIMYGVAALFVLYFLRGPLESWLL